MNARGLLEQLLRSGESLVRRLGLEPALRERLDAEMGGVRGG